MLKHATHSATAAVAVGASSASTGAGGGSGSGAANGQLRNNSNVASATPTSTKPAPNSITTPLRNIQLRPPQPLNASALNISSINAPTPTLLNSTINSTTNNKIYSTNGGQRISNVLSNNAGTPTLSTPPLQHLTNGTAMPIATLGTTSSNTTIKRITPVTNITTANSTVPNGQIGINHNFHTYTNQYMLANNLNSSNANNFINSNTNHNHHHNHHTNTVQTQNNLQTSQHKSNHNHISLANNTTNTQHPKYSNCNNLPTLLINQSKHGPGPHEAITSLGLLCLVSLLFALLSLIFLFKISPNSREDAILRNPNEDFVLIYDITLALCALSLSLNLCCLLVCATQFLFAVKLDRSPSFEGRANKYLQKSSASRTCAVAGFFISIPIFLTGIILYTFNHFHSTPAIITSVLIGFGIVFCGGAMVHNVFLWQKEKTITYRSPPLFSTQIGPITPPPQYLNSPPQQFNFNQSQQPSAFLTNNPQPVSPNESHASFNPLGCGAVSSSFLIRPATATPTTPKPLLQTPNTCGGPLNSTLNTTTATIPTVHSGVASPIAREDRSSVSPNLIGTLDMSVSLYELSTLV